MLPVSGKYSTGILCCQYPASIVLVFVLPVSGKYTGILCCPCPASIVLVFCINSVTFSIDLADLKDLTFP